MIAGKQLPVVWHPTHAMKSEGEKTFEVKMRWGASYLRFASQTQIADLSLRICKLKRRHGNEPGSE
jgi:hypothetical protein